MRLITKTILYYLLISLPLLALAGYFGYTLVKKEIQDSTDEYLWKEKLNAEQMIRSQSKADVIYLSTDSLSKVVPVSDHETGYFYGDTRIYDRFEEEILDFRVLKSYYQFKNQHYLITIFKSTMEDDDLMESLYKTFALIAVLLVLVFFILSWVLSKTLWKPFYKSVDQLSNYDIQKHTVLNFESSSVKEFKQLNGALTKMTEKIYIDYIRQKEFTENASHEMQTPLAVIKANLNLLMQSPNLKEVEMNQVQSIENTVRKLSALNKGLLLVSKIENDQFQELSDVHLTELIRKNLEIYHDLIEAKSIELKLDLADNVHLTMNPSLADVLISNLIQNAVRHNHQNGAISITLSQKSLVVSNSGNSLTVPPEQLFERFKKDSDSKESLGLGLSIVQSIAKLYGFKVDYQYLESKHVFTLKFGAH